MKNLRLINYSIIGISNCGGVVGSNYGIVSNCYANGNVSERDITSVDS